jgi:hypothetical protein
MLNALLAPSARHRVRWMPAQVGLQRSLAFWAVTACSPLEFDRHFVDRVAFIFRAEE